MLDLGVRLGCESKEPDADGSELAGVEALWCDMEVDVVLRARFSLSLGVRGEASRARLCA